MSSSEIASPDLFADFAFDGLGPAQAAPDAPTVSVIIPHYNDLENLRACLALLRSQTAPRDAFEIIVVDNNSDCGLAAVAAVCDGHAILIAEPNQGAAAARNAGVARSRGRCLAFLDSDCRPSPLWLERGVEALAAADMVGGRVDVRAASAEMTAVEAFELVFAFNIRRYIEKMSYSGTGNMFVPRAVFDDVGAFRSGVPEDLDWGRRAVALGYRWAYAPKARVAHPARRDWEALTRKWRRLIEESYGAAKCVPFGRLRWILRSWLVLASPLVHCVTIARSPRLRGREQKLKAIGVLFRLRLWRFWASHALLFKDARRRS